MNTTEMPSNILFFLIFTFCINVCVSKRYDNYTLYRVIPAEKGHLNFLKNLSKLYNANFWREPGLLMMPVDFVINPEVKPVFLGDANNMGLYLTTIIEDVQQAFDKQTVKTYILREMDSFSWLHYYRLNDIYQWLQDLAKAYPLEMELQSIGKSYENRDILAVSIVLKECKRRSKVIVEGGIHAREWISPAFVTYLINEIIRSQESQNEALKRLALLYEWYFVPVMNPDGYEYSHVADRMWRKNRHHEGPVDLNRNFDQAFGTNGVQTNDRNSETFCGWSPFSERESFAMANFVKSRSDNLEYYFAFHSYGQYMILPYGHTQRHEDNFYDVQQMCNKAAYEIAVKYKTRYTVGNPYDTVGYLTSGVSGCWVKEYFRVPYVVTFELRDRGVDGFALAPSKILPTCRETMDGLLSLLEPRTPVFSRLQGSYYSAGPAFILDKIVISFNTFLFIIVRFD